MRVSALPFNPDPQPDPHPEQATQFHPAVRACAATLTGSGRGSGASVRHRPAQFSATERAELASLAAARGAGWAEAGWTAQEEVGLHPWDGATLGALDPEAGLASLPLSEAEVR